MRRIDRMIYARFLVDETTISKFAALNTFLFVSMGRQTEPAILHTSKTSFPFSSDKCKAEATVHTRDF